MSQARFAQLRPLLDRIQQVRILVVGDLYLDHYIFGEPIRLSREAPVPVLDEHRQEDWPGGGTAPALEVAALGGQVWQAGIVGDDDEGRRLTEILCRRGVNVDGIFIDSDRPTTTKLRVVAEGPSNVFPQQIARVDRQDRQPLSDEMAGKLAGFISDRGPAVDAVLISDYRSGAILPPVVEAARASAELVTVDSQGALGNFRGLTLVKCNQGEAESFIGQALDDPHERQARLTALRDELDCRMLVVTLGPAGAAMIGPHGHHEVSPQIRRQVFDVTGAGDMVIAVLTAALAADADPLSALQLSQVAAGLAVAKWGNAQVPRHELEAALDGDE